MRNLGKLAIAIIFSLLPVASYGAVSGYCGTCHIMHNSQGGVAQVMGGPGTGWSGDNGQLTGGSVIDTPVGGLLVTGCIGCHSSTSSETIIDIGGAKGSKIPIVYNTTGYPSDALAGGNFYWVAQGSGGSCPNGGNCDEYGHNVFGISSNDSILTVEAPGRNEVNCAKGCHVTLADPPNIDNEYKGGCMGCHYKVAHHDDSKPWYRFLVGNNSDDHHVEGIEDPNWEQNPSVTNHNVYKGVAGPIADGTSLSTTKSISSYCGGCHGNFHWQSYITDQTSAPFGPWKRHPTDILLPTTGEYAGYNPPTDYNNMAPVAYVDLVEDRNNAVVMCLSCHRPHGSQYPDMLRWDYEDDCDSNVDNENCGCFKCHNWKDAT